jgi:hypothetical protein
MYSSSQIDSSVKQNIYLNPQGSQTKYFTVFRTSALSCNMPLAEPHSENYLLVMSGSIKSAPFLKGWKTLKDHIRKNVGSPGYTHVNSASETGIHRGWCNFVREDDAKAAYSM